MNVQGGKKSLKGVERIKYEASVNKTVERGGVKACIQEALASWENGDGEEAGNGYQCMKKGSDRKSLKERSGEEWCQA